MTINKCNIIQDILPLYVEKMASEDTVCFIEEHLAGCEKCREKLEKICNCADIADKQCDCKAEANVIKNVKKKIRTRRIVLIVLSVLLTLAVIFVFSVTRAVTIDYGISEKYTQEEMEQATQIIIDKMNSFEGCILYSISYRGDEFCERELEYCNTLADEEKGEVFVDCIVFSTEFRSPIFGGGAWNPNRLYHWTWYLARTEGGSWVLLTWGMP